AFGTQRDEGTDFYLHVEGEYGNRYRIFQGQAWIFADGHSGYGPYVLKDEHVRKIYIQNGNHAVVEVAVYERPSAVKVTVRKGAGERLRGVCTWNRRNTSRPLPSDSAVQFLPERRRQVSSRRQFYGLAILAVCLLGLCSTAEACRRRGRAVYCGPQAPY